MEHGGLLLLLESTSLAQVAAAAGPSPVLCIAPGSAPAQPLVLALAMPPEMLLDLFWAPRCHRVMALNHCA